MLADDPYSGKMALKGGKKCRRGENTCVHVVGGWERDFISEHSGSCDLNPKKEIECVWRREYHCNWQ